MPGPEGLINIHDIVNNTNPHQGRSFRVAADALGVEMTTADTNYWIAASGAAEVLDVMVDDLGYEDVAPFTDIFTSGQPASIEGALTIKGAETLLGVYQQLSPERQAAWQAAAAALPELYRQRIAATTISELIDVNMAEAEHVFAPAYYVDVTDTPDAEARLRMNQWILHFSRAGYAIDNAFDMPIDFKEGKISVPPTTRNRLTHLYAGRYDIFQSVNMAKAIVPRAAKLIAVSLSERGGEKY